MTVRPAGDLRNQRLEDVLPPTWDVAAMRGLLVSDTGAVSRQIVRASPGTPGPSWDVDARAMASQDAPGQRQVLIVATPEPTTDTSTAPLKNCTGCRSHGYRDI